MDVCPQPDADATRDDGRVTDGPVGGGMVEGEEVEGVGAGRLVIVGGGFAGFWAAAAARRVGGEALSITLVAPQPSLVMRPRLYEAHPEDLAVDLLPLLDTLGVQFVAGVAEALDLDATQLTLGSGEIVPFDRLVVATGSVMGRPPVPGAADAHSIDTQADAIRFDVRLAAVAEMNPRPVVVIVGAGSTGIELALELRDRIALHGGVALGQALRIVLVDRAERVGHELGDNPRPVIEDALSEADVELRLGAAIQELADDRVVFVGSGGAGTEVLEADIVLLATGPVAAPFAARVPGRRDEMGRIMVDPFLRSLEASRVFVTGDAAAADTGDGHLALASCQHALQLGRVAGENAARDLLGSPLVPYAQLRYVTCLDLGRSGAVFTEGWDCDVALVGAEAKARKTMINTQVIYPPRDAGLGELLRQSALDPADRG